MTNSLMHKPVPTQPPAHTRKDLPPLSAAYLEKSFLTPNWKPVRSLKQSGTSLLKIVKWQHPLSID